MSYKIVNKNYPKLELIRFQGDWSQIKKIFFSEIKHNNRDLVRHCDI